MEFKYVKNVTYNNEDWLDIKNLAMATIGKKSARYPSDEWKKTILKAEHSPIRRGTVTIELEIPYWVSTHFVRHKIGVEHFISTQRSDRTGIDRNNKPQGSLVSHTIVANYQALITISRKRLCSMASPETRAVWEELKEVINVFYPELASVMVKECIYRGFCPEFKSCGYCDTNDWFNEVTRYRRNDL